MDFIQLLDLFYDGYPREVGTAYLDAITKKNISYVPLNPFADYIHILDLNTRLHIGWKTLPNLNFELKFQTQTWISKTKIFPVLPGNLRFW